MKINAKSLEFANRLVGNKPPPIMFYLLDSDKKLNPSDYQAYKLRNNPCVLLDSQVLQGGNP
eukprot:4794750-Ditylum_brightwellii.AAC.1